LVQISSPLKHKIFRTQATKTVQYGLLLLRSHKYRSWPEQGSMKHPVFFNEAASRPGTRVQCWDREPRFPVWHRPRVLILNRGRVSPPGRASLHHGPPGLVLLVHPILFATMHASTSALENSGR
jgi:hypothetical protein